MPLSKLCFHFDNFIESKISGIPCLIRIDPTLPDEAWEFTVFDMKGYKANWLASKLNTDSSTRIENEIEESFIQDDY